MHKSQTLASLLVVKISNNNSLPALGHWKLQVYVVCRKILVRNLNSNLSSGLSETGPRSFSPFLQCRSSVSSMPNLLTITTCLDVSTPCGITVSFTRAERPNDAFVRRINRNLIGVIKTNLRFVDEAIMDCVLRN